MPGRLPELGTVHRNGTERERDMQAKLMQPHNEPLFGMPGVEIGQRPYFAG